VLRGAVAGESGGSVASSGTEAGDSARTYRPHLDGLRAVAVYLVVLFHAGSGRFSGGYIGVDVFFVLSGYLVTQLLMRDMDRIGSIRFGRFYSRRFRRLLPAAFVALIVTAVVYTAIEPPVAVAGAVSSFKAAFLYSTNWYFIHHATSYFSQNVSMNPVLHFWSLAVEEQFYLVWPLALGGGFVLTRRMDRRRQMNAIRIAIALGALASVVWALSLRSSDPNRAYYGTDTRAYELLAGALLALVPTLIDSAKRARRLLRVASLLGVVSLLVVASSIVHFDAIERGVGATIATGVLIVAIEAADGGLVKRALSSRLMVYLGKISYGTYLWHWLVILVVLETFQISTIATVGIACLVATALASLSFQVLEHPIRVSGFLDRYRVPVIASGLVLSVISALVLIPAIVDPARATTPVLRNGTSNSSIPVPDHLPSRRASVQTGDFPSCFAKPVSACTLVKGAGPKVLLIGDSHAWMLIPAFREIARIEGLTLSASLVAGCPWQRGLYTPFQTRECRSKKEDLYQRVIAGLHPDVVIVMNLDYGRPGPYPQPVERADLRQAKDADVADATTSSITALRSGGRRVVIIEPIPVPRPPRESFDPLACLQKATVLEQCRYAAAAKPLKLDLLYRSIGRRDDGVQVLNLDKAVCPLFPMCDPMVNGQVVKFDQSHLTKQFVLTLVPQIDVFLRRTGTIPR
jgi:peptidoglycan/LPS O-acetylase OafA/YrhL